jgi:prefoldin subunit 5
MNKHFEDTRYYVKRAGETAAKGLQEELEPIERRLKELAGGEDEAVSTGRIEELRADLQAVQEKAEGEAKKALGEARAKLDAYRTA